MSEERPTSRPDGPVLFRIEDGVGWITLNRPERRNALDRAALVALGRATQTAAADPSCRVLVLTGTGSAFCAGADLAEVDGPDREEYLDLLHATLSELRAYPRPVVGALNGTTVAGGLELALCCDLLIAASSARIGDAHLAYGLVPGAGGVTILPGRIGRQRANQLLLTGGLESAETLRQWGLVNWVVADDELVPRAAALASELAAKSPAALVAIKALSRPADLADLLAGEGAAMRAHLTSSDAREGLAAFKDKRRPRFDPPGQVAPRPPASIQGPAP